MQKVWNVSDGPRSKAEPAVLMLFGRSVRPGRFVAVSEDRLARAHKLEQDKEAWLVYVGSSLPSWYKEVKTPVHARFPVGHKRAHGPKVEKEPAKAMVVEVTAAPIWEMGDADGPTLPAQEESSKDSEVSNESEEQSGGRKKRRNRS